MRKLLLALPVVLLSTACSNFTWKGHKAGLTEDQRARGIKGIDELVDEYETARFWRDVRRRRDGRVNALGRDLMKIQDTLDRHLFNYSPNDPYVNHPTDLNIGTQLGRLGTSFIAR